MALDRRHSDKQILNAFKRSREYNSYMTGAKYNPSNPYLYDSREMEGTKRWYNAGVRAALLHEEERRQSEVERGLGQRAPFRPTLDGTYSTEFKYGSNSIKIPNKPKKVSVTYNGRVREVLAPQNTGKFVRVDGYGRPLDISYGPNPNIPRDNMKLDPQVSKAKYMAKEAQILDHNSKVPKYRTIRRPTEARVTTFNPNTMGSIASIGADYVLMKSIDNGNDLMSHIITNGHNADRVYTGSGKVADTFGDQNYPQNMRNYMVTGKDGKRYFRWKEALKNGDIYTSPEGNIMYREGNPHLMKDGGGIGFLNGMGNKVPRNYLTQKMIDQIPEPDKHMIPGYRPQPITPTGNGGQKPKPRPRPIIRPRPVSQPKPNPQLGHVAPDYIQGPGGEVNRPRFDLGMINPDRSGVSPDEEFVYNEPHQSMRYDRRRPGYYGGRY